jgi:uncharacterized protein YndB with AHSA1/START domain
MSTTDRIEKHVTLKAPRDRVWAALTDSQRFGVWFGCQMDGPFVAGKPIKGTMTPTQVDDATAKMQEPFRGMTIELTIDRIEPKDRFSFRWHPFAIEKDFDYSGETMTLVMFELSDAPGGHTELRITESGFDKLPASRRERAFSANEGGWRKQIDLIGKYLAR